MGKSGVAVSSAVDPAEAENVGYLEKKRPDGS